MLGNLGYSSVECDLTPVLTERIGMLCSFGQIGQIFDFGIHEGSLEDTFEMCVNDEYMSQCKPDNLNFVSQLNQAKAKQKYSFNFSVRGLY